MRKVFSIVCLLLIPQILAAYETGMLNLETPGALEKGQGEFKIQHRFYGKASEEPLDTFFGMDLGANIGLSLRYTLWSKLELRAARFRSAKEGILGASYSYPVPKSPLQSQVYVEFFSYEEFNFETSSDERKNSVFGLLSLQSEPVFGRIIPTVNAGYDADGENFGAGLGLAIIAFEELGLVRRITLMGEYYPTRGEEDHERSFAFGIRFQTYGHHFDLILSNNSELGVRHLMSGAVKTEGLRFGFNIKRLLGES